MHILLAVFAMLFAACNSTESDNDPTITKGTYQHIYSASDGAVTVQFIFGDGSYQGKTYVHMNDGSIDCLIGEGVGKWAVAGGALKLTEKKVRGRELCTETFPEWADRPSSNEEIRNITATTFELYLEADEDLPAEWVKFTKL